MDKFLEVLCTVISVVLPIVAAVAVRLLLAKTTQVKAETTNENARNIMDEAYKAISTAVIYTSQTFVDALKQSGSFDADKQKEALNIAVEKTYEMLSDTAITFIDNTYGDIEEWVITNIEKEVNLNK
jgi:hypothetical protein